MIEKQAQALLGVQDDILDERSAGVIKAILTLLDTLSPADREKVQREISFKASPLASKKIGDVLGVVLKLIPKTGNWSVDQIKKQVLDKDVEAKPKDIYNAVNYLSRKGCIKRISYGRYVTSDGFCFKSSDEIHAEPPHRGGDADD